MPHHTRTIPETPPSDDPDSKESQRLTSSITIRLTPKERERLEEEADLAGLSISEIIRRRIFSRPIVAKVDMAVIRELRRQGGLLKHLHSKGGGCKGAIEQTLVEIRSAIEKIARNDDQAD